MHRSSLTGTRVVDKDVVGFRHARRREVGTRCIPTLAPAFAQYRWSFGRRCLA